MFNFISINILHYKANVWCINVYFVFKTYLYAGKVGLLGVETATLAAGNNGLIPGIIILKNTFRL